MDNPKKITTKIFTGESGMWQIKDFKIKVSPMEVRISAGTINMKGHQSYLADYFKVEAHIIFNEVILDQKIYEFELTPEKPTLITSDITDVKLGELNIAKQSTSNTFGLQVLNKYNEPVPIEDISLVYFIIEWKGIQDSTHKREKIILKQSKNKSLSN